MLRVRCTGGDATRRNPTESRLVLLQFRVHRQTLISPCDCLKASGAPPDAIEAFFHPRGCLPPEFRTLARSRPSCLDRSSGSISPLSERGAWKNGDPSMESCASIDEAALSAAPHFRTALASVARCFPLSPSSTLPLVLARAGCATRFSPCATLPPLPRSSRAQPSSRPRRLAQVVSISTQVRCDLLSTCPTRTR